MAGSYQWIKRSRGTGPATLERTTDISQVPQIGKLLKALGHSQELPHRMWNCLSGIQIPNFHIPAHKETSTHRMTIPWTEEKWTHCSKLPTSLQ